MKSLNEYIKRQYKFLTTCIVESLQQTRLFEMAYSRKEYMDYLDSQIDNLVENWCLCKYCTLFDKKNQNHNHWHQELTAIFLKATRMKCQVDKGKAAREQLLTKAELNDSVIIKDIISYKFKKESLPLHLIDELAKLFIDELPILIRFLSTTNKRQEVSTYCYSV